jgi:acetoin utilization protein AcuB
MKQIKALMKSRVVTVEMDDTLYIVKEIFAHTHFHHLLVIENHKLAGVISDRDFFKAISPQLGTAAELPRDAASLNKRAHQIMSRTPITLPPDAPLNDAVKLLIDHPISCIPVVDANLHIHGIITWRDLIPELIRTT